MEIFENNFSFFLFRSSLITPILTLTTLLLGFLLGTLSLTGAIPLVVYHFRFVYLPPYDHPSFVTLPFSATYLCQRLSFNLFAVFTYLHIHLLSQRGYEPVPTCIRLPHVPEEPVPCYSSHDLSPRRVPLLFSTLPQVSARLVSSCTLGPSNCAS